MTTPKLLAIFNLILAPMLAQAGEIDNWYLQTSIYTTHFHPDSDHNNNQRLIGLEHRVKSGGVAGGATFLNSFDQRSVYAYAGKRFDSEQTPFYLKVTGGLIHGYRGEYRDKIPLNRYGIAPAIIPSAGLQVGKFGGEVVLLGNSAMMVNFGLYL